MFSLFGLRRRYGHAGAKDPMKAFWTAAKKVEKSIAEVAAGAGADGGYQELEAAVWKAINRLDDRTAAPEIRGDDAIREKAWAEVSRLREAMRAASETGREARIAIRNGQIRDLRAADAQRIENMSPRERETYYYQQELAKDRARRGQY